jgi:hypothetical protein
MDLGTGAVTFSTTGHPPAVYCVHGLNSSIQVNGLDLTAGDGYTFFALDGGKINVAGNGSKLKFYWPTAQCGARPTNRSQTCLGQGSYDPFTLLDATSEVNGANCTDNAICLNGQSNDMTGDMFAAKPDVFPPPPGLAQTGGVIAVEGGGLSAGSGFLESWKLTILGNTGNYQGTGASIVIPGGTQTTTDPSTTIIIPSSTGAATTVATTLGTTLDLSQ